MNDRRGNNDGYDVASRRRLRAHPPPPEAGTLWDGVIQRIQPYGAFCSFGPLSGRESIGTQRDQHQRQRRTWQGLIHISQLSETRVEKVEDVVNVDDPVWVKVLEVEKQQAPDHGTTDQHFNARYRIKLSMKDVSQDGTRQDLGREREAKEQVTTQLETNLNSMIGMGVALDPMERLVLKNSSYGGKNANRNSASTKTTFRGGYTLVGDDEGEPEPDPSTTVAENTNRTVRTAPMGRGRGATLPAWMTSAEGPVGASDEPQKSKTSRKKDTRDGKNGRDKYRDHSDYDDDDSRHRSSRRREKKDRKRHKKKSRHGRRKRSDDYSDSESSDRSDYGERRHRKRHKSSSRRHKRKDHRKDSSKIKDRKKRKLSRQRDDYGKDDDEKHRRSESRRYNSDDESSHGNATSDSRSSYSSR